MTMTRSVALTVTCMLLLSCSRQEVDHPPDTDSARVPRVGWKQDRPATNASIPVPTRQQRAGQVRRLSRPSRRSIQKLSNVDLPNLVQSVKDSVVRIDVITSSGRGVGSGFVAHRRDIIITNHHVVANARRATVTFSDKTTSSVEGAILLSPSSDVAILKLSKQAMGKPLPLAIKSPQLGESVIAIGMPENLSFSISSGIVSAVRTSAELKRLFPRDKIPGTNLVQTTAQISHGNSGGPLINMKGEVVGMNTFTLVKGQNLNFAVSSLDILAAVRQGIAKMPIALAPSRPHVAPNDPEVVRPKPAVKLTITPAARLNQIVLRRIDQQRKSWVQTVKDVLEKQKTKIARLETLIKQESRTMAYVQRNRGDTKKILGTLTRRLWFSRAKGRLANYRRILAEHMELRKSVETTLSQNLLPIPAISDGGTVGDFGVLRNATVLRVLGKKEFLVASGGKTFYCRNFESANWQVGTKLAGPFLVVIAGTYQYLDLSGIKSVSVLQPASTPDLRANYDRLLAFQKAEEARVAA